MTTTSQKSSKRSLFLLFSPRLQKELFDFIANPPLNCFAGPKEGNLYQWVSTIVGPEDTPYADGIFFLDISFPETYPFQPPTVTFRTRIYHCNVNSNGSVCLDVLRENWNPIFTISHILLFILSLLNEPNAGTFYLLIKKR